MDFQYYADLFWKQGFLAIPDFFDADLMENLHHQILDHYGLDPAWEHTHEFIQQSATEVIPWFPIREGDPQFLPIQDHQDLKLLTEKILGINWNELYLMIMFSKKGTKGQAWHQDCPPENPKFFNLNRLFYTHDITTETGGEVIVMPGSHKLGELPAGMPHGDIPGQVKLKPQKGTLIFLHGHTWHRVLPVNGKFRISGNARAIPAETPEDITDIAVYRNMRYRFSTNEVIEVRKHPTN